MVHGGPGETQPGGVEPGVSHLLFGLPGLKMLLVCDADPHVGGNIGNSHNPGRGTWNASVPRTRTHGKLRHGRTSPVEESRTHNRREKNSGEKKHHNFSYANASVHDTLPAIEERVENTTRAESGSASFKVPAKRLPHYLFMRRIGYKWM